MVVCIFLYMQLYYKKVVWKKVGQNHRALYVSVLRLRVGSWVLGHQFFQSLCQSRWREAQECAYIAPGSVFLHHFTVYENSFFSHQNNAYFFKNKKNRGKKEVPQAQVFVNWLGMSYSFIFCTQGLLLLGFSFTLLLPYSYSLGVCYASFSCFPQQDLVAEDAKVAALLW